MVALPVFLVVFVAVISNVQTEVTNEDIKNVIIEVVKIARSAEEKNERHDYREKVLGEQLKKSLINIDKRIKMLDPLKETIGKLDKRLADVQTLLMQKDEKVQQKTLDVVQDMQKNLTIMIEQLRNYILNKTSIAAQTAQIIEPEISKMDFEKMENEVLNKIDKVTSTINNMENEILKIRIDNKNLTDINNRASENLEKVKRQLNTSEQLLTKYETKLAEYNNKIPGIPLVNNCGNDEWKKNFLQALEIQKSEIKEILSNVKTVKDSVNALPEKSDIRQIQNSTLEKLQKVESENVLTPGKCAQLLHWPLIAIHADLEDKNNKTLKSIGELLNVTNTLTQTFSTNYEKIRAEIQALGKLEQVGLRNKMVNDVLNTKRRTEYGVHQILAEVSKQIKEAIQDINQGVNKRFDNFEMSILDEESGALANLTSKMGEEVNLIWRQIDIMFQQMNASTNTLNNFKNQTDSYINGSLNAMGGMKIKVDQITRRMVEVDDSLNHLLGKLSLVTHEFNSIKSDLGKAVDEIKNSFNNVQNEIKGNKRPRTHNITSAELDNPVMV